MLSRLRGGLRRAFPPVPALDRRGRVALFAIVGLGGLARLVWMLVAAEPPGGDPVPRDPGFYLLLGEMVSGGDGYSYLVDGFRVEPTAYYPPGYPLALGGLLWLVGLLPGDVSSFGVAMAFNLVLSTATVALVFELGRRLVSGRVGLAAAAVLAAWPNVIIYSGVVLTETMFLFLLVLLLLVALPTPEVARSPGWRRIVATGLLVGVVGLVRPTSFVIAPLFLLLWWPAGVAVAVKRTAAVGAATLLVVAPWTIRNLVTMEAPVLVSTNFGDNLCIGHNPDATGGYTLTPTCFEGLDTGERPEFETHRQSVTTERAWRYIREDPAQVVTLMPAKLRHTLDSDADGLRAAADYERRQLFAPGTMDALKLLSNGYYLVALAAAGVGAVLLLRQEDAGRRRLFLLATAAVQLVPPLLTFGDPRFKFPLYPVAAVCAGLVLIWLVDRAGPLRADPAAPAGPAGSGGPAPGDPDAAADAGHGHGAETADRAPSSDALAAPPGSGGHGPAGPRH